MPEFKPEELVSEKLFSQFPHSKSSATFVVPVTCLSDPKEYLLWMQTHGNYTPIPIYAYQIFHRLKRVAIVLFPIEAETIHQFEGIVAFLMVDKSRITKSLYQHIFQPRIHWYIPHDDATKTLTFVYRDQHHMFLIPSYDADPDQITLRYEFGGVEKTQIVRCKPKTGIPERMEASLTEDQKAALHKYYLYLRLSDPNARSGASEEILYLRELELSTNTLQFFSNTLLLGTCYSTKSIHIMLEADYLEGEMYSLNVDQLEGFGVSKVQPDQISDLIEELEYLHISLDPINHLVTF